MADANLDPNGSQAVTGADAATANADGAVQDPNNPDVNTGGTGAEPTRDGKDAQSRIRQLVAKGYRDQAEIDALKARLERTEAGGGAQPSKTDDEKPVKPVMPRIGNFTGDDAFEKYEAAMEKFHDDTAEYHRKLAASEAKQASKASYEQARQDEAASRVASTFDERTRAAEAKNPAIREAMNDTVLSDVVKRNPALFEAIRRSPVGPELILKLHGDFAEAQRLATLDPLTAVMEVGRMAAALSAPPDKKKTISQAPEPIAPLNAGGSPVPDRSKETMDQYAARRRREMVDARKAGMRG